MTNIELVLNMLAEVTTRRYRNGNSPIRLKKVKRLQKEAEK